MSIKITSIDKPSGNLLNPHEAINRYGWINESTGVSGISLRVPMVEWIKNGGTAYVKDQYGHIAYCQIRLSQHSVEFLQTVTDGKWSNNLLSLPRITQ